MSNLRKLAQNPEELYKTSPPNFGHGVLNLFSFDPRYVNLNHGSYGSLPTPVRVFCDQLSARIESNPDIFHRLDYMEMLLDVRRQVAQLIGADVDECFMVQNAGSGISTVMKNIEWNADDIIIAMSTAYNSVAKTAEYIADTPPHPQLLIFDIKFPTSHSAIVDSFRKFLRTAVADRRGQGKDVKFLALFDAIVSNPGVLMPWREMVNVCKEEDVLSLVDAAHSIGQEVGLDLGKIQPDFWVSNGHKWLFSKRGSAVLYVNKRNHHLIRSTFPTSYAYASRASGLSTLAKQFEWSGTLDWAPILSVTAALEFRRWLGGEEKINEYCHDLSLKGGKRLAEILGTKVMDSDEKPGELTLNMVNVRAPLSPEIEPSPELDAMYEETMLREHGTFAPMFFHGGKWWVRASAQIWNEIQDFEVLGKAVLDVCRKACD